MKLNRRVGGGLRFEWLSRSDDALVADGWYDDWTGPLSQHLGVSGHLVNAVLTGNELMYWDQALIDALNWFSEALSEPLAGTQVLKFAAATERLTISERERATGLFVIRGAILAHDGTLTDFEEWVRKAKKVYERRSDLIHGNISPLNSSNEEIARQARELARRVIHRGMELAAHMSPFVQNRDPTKEMIGKFFEKTEKAWTITITRMRPTYFDKGKSKRNRKRP